ncbi:hypothetical protein JAAARDRAFT_485542 [Jaapia argillacea MUCL 33604]|uniref:Uncharacterized protein n=1 Tax=Jaapia argillacea MUCL 33604 TaxID=933084 RepID=A0A067PBR5_9AGAM|nr:hypothetical protein JAAARDRAFT_485542 [Jaapia argillacea MUCL 33604]
MAGIVQVALALHSGYDQVRWNFMEPYGYINTTPLKGYPNPCNNPFWGGYRWTPKSYTSANYAATTAKLRSPFSNHAFIALRVDNNPLNSLVLDATSGPHLGDERLSQYLTNAIDITTNYYAQFHTRYGTVNDINPSQNGITSLQPLTSASTSFQPAATETRDMSSVEETLDRAKVENSDPPRFTRVHYNSLQRSVVQKLSIDLATQNVEPSEYGSRSYWRLGGEAGVVEVELVIAESHEVAVDAMRQVLSCISAPLDIIFPSNAGLGQRSLSGVGGRGYILFVRDNAFVTIQGLGSSEALKGAATLVDEFLKAAEVDGGGRVDGPIFRGGVPSDQPPRKVTLGEIFEVVVPVDDAGWMEASTDIGMVQLVGIDRERATFKFHAAGEGSTEIVLVFIHGETMKTTSTKVAIEILPGKEESPMLEV